MSAQKNAQTTKNAHVGKKKLHFFWIISKLFVILQTFSGMRDSQRVPHFILIRNI